MKEIKEFKVGTRVHMNDEPETNCGTITDMFGGGARVSWDNGNATNERLFDLTPIVPDTPRTRVGKLIAHWNKTPTKADLQAVRAIVQNAVDGCGLDATAEVVIDTDHDIPTLGHFPYKAVIKINGAYPAIRMRNGNVVKGMDTITVQFCRKVGLFNFDECGKRHKEEERLFKELPKDKAMAAIDALPWDAELVDFSARTNGLEREYRHRHWFPFEGGVSGYGADHIGGHFGYADTWENLKEDFAAYIRKVATDLGYAGKVWRKEVA